MTDMTPEERAASTDYTENLSLLKYVRKVIDGGGFKKYEQAHLATLTKTFEPKFTMLPKELVRHVVSFWLHAGYY